MRNLIFTFNRKTTFITIATAIVLVNIFGINSFGANVGSFAEVAVLTDFVFVIPCIYILCFRKELKRALIKSIAIASLGFWGAGLLIPESQQSIIQEYGTFRYIGLTVLFLIELKLALVIWRAVFKGVDKDEIVTEITDSSDMPEWVARLMAWEASIWRKIIQKFRKSE